MRKVAWDGVEGRGAKVAAATTDVRVLLLGLIYGGVERGGVERGRRGSGVGD